MNTSLRSLTAAFSLAAAALLGTVAAARAQTPQNPIIITSAPYTITQAGYYRLGNNINSSATSGNLITVNANNVTIDFNGFYLAGPTTNPATTVYGIYANERSNLTITGGTIAYCYYGIYFSGNGSTTTNNLGHRIERMRIPRCYYLGIYLSGAVNSEITDNQINFTGGYTGSADVSPYGIYVSVGSVTITNNKVSTSTSSGSGTAYGIYCNSSNNDFVVGNRIDNCAVGLRMTSATPNGKYQDNLTANCATPFTGGTDAGGNN